MTLAEYEAQHPGFKRWLRDNFVGNECDSDEYGETQPAKGLGMIGDYVLLISEDREKIEHLVELMSNWLNVVLDSAFARYGGAEQLEPILRLYFDALWEINRHPYEPDDPEEMMQDYLHDFLEEQGLESN